MRKLPLAFICSAIFTIPASAEVADCLPIDNELDRLACYDIEAGRSPEVEEIEGFASNWKVDTETSAFDDSTTVYMSMSSNEPVRCGRYGTPQPISLYMRCKENTTSVFFGHNSCHLTSGHGGYGVVEYRIDQENAKDREFSASTDNSTLGLWRGGRSTAFIREFLDNDRLLLRFTPYGQSPVTAEFDISGTDEAIAPLREACGW
ncbi:type VI secretion system-associated protein TagO [Thalassobius sp. I31.1]|uniref:type VI secretion system-associated protein TagO n=1 Tax=Thalassobius sp. I31.1 TaxID=2109912 RepID=UPI000D1BA50E|nr:type VI secretion system-associated protein TagO [Thalassobius sp. I31.1]